MSDISSNLPSQRIPSVDAFRGITVTAMVFVNYLSEGVFRIENIPTWLRHAAVADSMTFVDIVFPAFVFIVGMVIPIAVENKLERGQSRVYILKHIFTRTLSLMLIGVYLGNRWEAQKTGCPLGISMELWGVLLLIAIVLVWNNYSICEGKKRILFLGFRTLGIAILIYLAIVFREGEQKSLFKIYRWGVLGTIAWSYLIGSTVYLIFRKNPTAILGCVFIFIFVYIGDSNNVFDRWTFLDGFRRYVPLYYYFGSWSTIVASGIFTGLLFMKDLQAKTNLNRFVWVCTFAFMLFFVGFSLRPIYGISKPGASPTWALYCSAICCMFYTVLYVTIEVFKIKRWATAFTIVGTNALFAYILSRCLFPLFELVQVDRIYNSCCNSGVAGIIKTMLLTITLILLAIWLISRKYIKLNV